MLRYGWKSVVHGLLLATFFAGAERLALRPALAVSLDEDGTMKLGMRTYVNARVGTENTNHYIRENSKSETFPYSSAGHLRQNRFFLEAEFDHDLAPLVKNKTGPFNLLNYLPFKIRGLKYHLVFRGEYDGLYDWGPVEFSTADNFYDPKVPPNQATGLSADDIRGDARKRLRDKASHRERLFQAYMEGSVGDLFIRFGRQILAWGETDGFRLLDNINPTDSSFGGFLIALDERRVPLDMLRLQYRIGDFGPVSEAFLEGYGAYDDSVAWAPGTPAGSPWNLPNLGAPSTTTQSVHDTPGRSWRGGGRFVWNMYDATFSLAHYYTYFDNPGLKIKVKEQFPIPLTLKCATPEDQSCYSFEPGYSAQAVQSAPLVQVTGATTTFAVPQFYTVVRSEFAFFHDEPRYTQSNLDPFTFHFMDKDFNFLDRQSLLDGKGRTTGGRRLGDSVNFVLGFDINRYIRFLNPNQTFFISTQFFYKHLLDAARRRPIRDEAQCASYDAQGRECPFDRKLEDGEVLPVPEQYITASGYPPLLRNFKRLEPKFVRNPTDQFLNTLGIGTAYMSGRVNPFFTFFYDWGGAMVFQPSVTLLQDPFRFAIDYSILSSHSLKGGSGVGLLKDRDNVQFRFEYVM